MKRRRRIKREEPLEEEDDLTPEPGELAATNSGNWRVKIVALLPLVACFVGTSYSPVMLAVCAAVIGLLTWFWPAQGKVPYSLLMVFGVIAVLTLLPALPLPLPFVPDWRASLVNDYGIALPNTWSPQPWVTLDRWVMMVMLMIWFLWIAAQSAVAEARAEIIRTLAVGLSLLGVLAIAFRAIDYSPMEWGGGGYGGRDFGPLSNRNHFSCLMALNAVLCLAAAYDLLRRKERRWVLYALGIVPSFAVVLTNTSRAGVVLFFLGLIGWFALAALRKSSMKRIAIAAAMVLACTAAAVTFGQKIMARFGKDQGGAVSATTTEGRLAVWEATLDLVLRHPILGVGLGNYDAIFNMTHHMPDVSARYAHPESDLLWFMAEAGWPATLALIFGVLLFSRWLGPWWQSKSRSAQRRQRRLRLAAGLGLLLAWGHGLVDVPLHGLAMGLLLCLLAGLAIYGARFDAAPGTSIAGILKGGGVLCLGASASWSLVAMGLPSPMGYIAWYRASDSVNVLDQAGNTTAAMERVNTALQAAPLDWLSWSWKGTLILRMGGSEDLANDCFARARFLEPHLAKPCMDEAEVWLRHNSLMAVPAWREALRRDPWLQLHHYEAMLYYTRQFPELKEPVRALATNARLLRSSLRYADTDEVFLSTLDQLIERYPTLEGLTPPERGELFYMWANRGDKRRLADLLDTHSDWMEHGWPARCRIFAADGKFRDAYTLAMTYIVTPMNLTVDGTMEIEALQREFSFNPSDPMRGFRLALAYRAREKWAKAVEVLESVASQKTPPTHVHYELAKTHAGQGDFPRAWACLDRYLQSR